MTPDKGSGAAPGLTVVIPAFNEENGIGPVLCELKATLDQAGIDSEIIVIDDGSEDETGRAALEAGARVLQHRSNRGYGAALKTGISGARHEVVAITDADGTYPARYIPEMLARMEHADMVVGARTGERVEIPLLRKPAKWLLNQLANYVSGAHIPDLNSGLRLFRRDVAIQYFSILPDQFSFTTTITMAMHCDKYAVRYIPIDYLPRTGKSKIVPWDAGSFGILILRTAMLFKPLRVFLPVVLVCGSYAVTKVFLDIVILGERNISASSILMFLSALVVLMIGMVGDAIATRLGRLNTHEGVPRDVDELTAERGTQGPVPGSRHSPPT